MNGRSRPLDNPMNWSFGIGRLFAIDLRVHILFVFGALVILWQNPENGGIGYGAIQIAMLFLIVLIHEFGHCFGCRSAGGDATEIMMWPLGGLATVAPPHRWKAHLITTMAGPAVNVGFCLVTAAVLILWTGSLTSVPWNPLAPTINSVSTAQYWLAVFFLLNYVILLFNLMPVYPLDGGRALQALLWPRMGYGRSTMLASGIGMIGAIVIGLLGLVTGQMLLFCIAAFGYITCMQQRQQLKAMGEMESGPFGYDFSRGYSSLAEADDGAPKEPGLLERRRLQREARRREATRRQKEVASERLDQTLAKVREQGLASLTKSERRFLEEETRRRQATGR